MASRSAGLLGEVTTIYTGTDLGLTEAPHLFQRGGWYYLTTAEGGTGYDHAVTLARSRDIRGPYETHPAEACDDGAVCTRKARCSGWGMGNMSKGMTGGSGTRFLCGRPQAGPRGPFCATGRETGLAEVRLARMAGFG